MELASPQYRLADDAIEHVRSDCERWYVEQSANCIYETSERSFIDVVVPHNRTS